MPLTTHIALSLRFFMISFGSFFFVLFGDFEFEKAEETLSSISFLSPPPCRGHLAGGRGGGGCEGCGKGCGRDSGPGSLSYIQFIFITRLDQCDLASPRG